MLAPTKVRGQAQQVLDSLASGVYDKQEKGEVQHEATLTDLFDRDVILHFRNVFQRSKSGRDSLTSIEFKDLLLDYLPEAQIDKIYRQIDVNDDGKVSFGEFINFLISSEAGTNWSNALYASKLIRQVEQADAPGVVHKELIDEMCYLSKPLPMLITGGRDGKVCLWNPVDLTPIAQIRHRDKNAVFVQDLYRNMPSVQRAKCQRVVADNPRRKPENAQYAITSLCLMPNSPHVCVGSADCSMAVYDLGTQDVCGRITELTEAPTALCAFVHAPQKADVVATAANSDFLPRSQRKFPQLIALGGSEGTLYIYTVSPEFGTFLDAGAMKKNQLMMQTALQRPIFNQKLHRDWITAILYVAELDITFISSTDGTVTLLQTTKLEKLRMFEGHEGSAVKSVGWCGKAKYVISAAERTILLWDPHSLELVSSFEELPAPVVKVSICDEMDQILAISTDKTVQIWHSFTFEPLQTVKDTTSYSPDDTLSSLVFVASTKTLFTAGNRVTSWVIDRSSGDTRRVEDGDLCAVLYNSVFHQVIVVTVMGVVELYQAQTGCVLRRFTVGRTDVHAKKKRKSSKASIDRDTSLEEFPLVKSASLDKQERRLIIVTVENNIEMWNFNNGACLFSFRPVIAGLGVSNKALADGISAIAYENVVVPGKVAVRKYLVAGTLSGLTFGCLDAGEEIDCTPSLYLRTRYVLPKSTNNSNSNTRKSCGGNERLAEISQTSLKASLDSNSIGSLREASESSHCSANFDETAVLWIKSLDTVNQILVSYGDGSLVTWDLEKKKAHSSFAVSRETTGPLLHCMKKKSENSEREAIESAPVVASQVGGILRKHVKLGGPTRLSILAKDLLSDSRKRSNMSILQSGSSSGRPRGHLGTFLLPNNRPQETQEPVGVVTRLRSSSLSDEEAEEGTNDRKKSEELVRAVDTSVENMELKQSSSRNPFRSMSLLTNSNVALHPKKPSIAASSRAGSVRLTPRMTVSENLTTAAISHSFLESSEQPSWKRFSNSVLIRNAAMLTSSFSPKNSQFDAISSSASTAEQGQLELSRNSDSIGLEPRPPTIDPAASSQTTKTSPRAFSHKPTSTQGMTKIAATQESSLLHHPDVVSNARTKEGGHVNSDALGQQISTVREEESSTKPATADDAVVVVDSVVVLTNPSTVIGACSDGLIRFWDVELNVVLCSCKYYLELSTTGKEVTNAASQDFVRSRAGGIDQTPPGTQARNVKLVKQLDRLRHLCLSEKQDKLIGAFDKGVVRVWAVVPHAITALKKQLIQTGAYKTHLNAIQRRAALAGIEFSLSETLAAELDDSESSLSTQQLYHGVGAGNALGGGVAKLLISPLTLLEDWVAHDSPILSVSYVSFDYNKKSACDSVEGSSGLDEPTTPADTTYREGLADKQNSWRNEFMEQPDTGFVLTAGLDQEVKLWRITGEFVGQFGPFVWDVDDSRTWHVPAVQEEDDPVAYLESVTFQLPPKIYKGVDRKKRALLAEQRANRPAGYYRKHNVLEIREFVKSLKERVAGREEASEAQNQYFTEMLGRHPVTDVEKTVQSSKYFKDTGVATVLQQAKQKFVVEYPILATLRI